MKTIPVILAVVMVCSFAAAAAGTDACTKSYMIQFGLSNTGTEVKAVQIVYGSMPALQGGDLTGNVLGADGSTLSAFSLRNPRNQFGDVMAVSEDGKNKTALTGTQVTVDSADLVVMFPVTAGAATFSLLDSKGALMASVDLSRAEDTATWNCTADWGITPPKEAAASPATTAKSPVDPGIVIGSVAIGAGLVLAGRRNR